MKKKLLIIAAILFILLIVGYLGYSIYFHNLILNNYAEKVGYDEELEVYLKEEDDVIYYVNVPEWWKLGNANLDVSTERVTNESGDIIREGFRSSLYIYPFGNELTINIILDYSDKDDEIKTVLFSVDKSGNLVDQENVSLLTKEVYENNKVVVDRILQLYRDMWGIF